MACGDPCIWEGDKSIPLVPTGIVTTTLGPLYITGDFTIGKNNVVVLEGVIYVGGSINMDKDCAFTGSGSIVAEGNIELAKTDDYGSGSGSIIMSINGDVTFKKEVSVAALIYAPDGDIKFDKDSSVTGAVVGSSIQADKLELFAYDASFYDGFRLPGYAGARFKLITYDIDLNSE